MPILKSGRAIGIYLKNFIDEVTSDEYGDIESITFGFRPQVSTTNELLCLLPIMYYESVNGRVDMESPKKSGFTYQEIVSGAAQWATEEIEELENWAKSNKELQEWLLSNLALIQEQGLNDRLDR